MINCFKCVDCEFEGEVFRIKEIFHVKVDDIGQGSYTFKAKCPRCGSLRVNVLPGLKEDDILISTESHHKSNTSSRTGS